MISEAVVVALITGVLAIISNLIISSQSAKDLYAKLDKQSDLADERIRGEIDVIKTKIEDLQTEVSKHNKVIERTYELERKSDVHGTEITNINHEIRDIKQKISSG